MLVCVAQWDLIGVSVNWCEFAHIVDDLKQNTHRGQMCSSVYMSCKY